MAGDFSFWQQQPQHAQLPETQPWFADNAAVDVTPAELALLQRLNGETMWWAESQASIAPVQQTTPVEEWAPAWWNGVSDLGALPADALPNQEVKPNNEWSGSAWNWPQGIDMKPQMEASLPAGLHPQASQDMEQFEVQADSMWRPWEQDQSNGQDDPSLKTGLQMGTESEPQDHSSDDLDPDKGLAAEMTSQVALFLAGGDFEEESDEDDVSALPEPALGEGTNSEAAAAAGSMTIDAPPFVPAALQTGSDAAAASNARTELRLDEILPKEANPVHISPSDGLNNTYVAMLQQSILPPELEDQKNFKKFKAAIAKAVLNFYKKQTPPTMTLLQKDLRENHQIPEDWLSVLLQVCARDTAKLYFIKPPMPGEEPTIYLMKKPMWFQGFVPREDGFNEHHQGAKGMGAIPPMIPLPEVPVAENGEMKETKRKQLRNASLGNTARKSSEKQGKSPAPGPIPLMPGVVSPAPVREARFKKADSAYAADMNGNAEGHLDVSCLLEELILAFPKGMHFSTLKEQLRKLNEGSFGETAFSCPKIAKIKIDGGGVTGGAEASQPSNPMLQEAMNQGASGKPWQRSQGQVAGSQWHG